MIKSTPAHHEEEFQDTCVAYLWRSPGALAKFEGKLLRAFFADATVGTIFLALERYHTEHKKVPSRAVLLEIIRAAYPEKDNQQHILTRKTVKEKLTYMDECDISDGGFIEEQLKEFIRYSALVQFATDAVNGIAQRKYDPDLPKKARTALESGMIDEDFGHDWTRSASARIHNATTPTNEPRVPTGVKHLDDLIGGGLKAGELGILLGLPKGFKSGTMANFAFSAMKVSSGLNVLYITLELEPELVGLRFDFCCANKTKEQLLADPEKFVKILKNRIDVLCGPSRLFIKYFRTKTATVDTLRNYIDRFQEHYGIKVGMLIVDYLDLMKPTRKREKSYQEDVDICEDLRDIAIEYRIPIWTACRATREAVGKKRISMAHMSRAFERVGVADLMIALCQTEQEKAQKILRLYLAAARNDEGEKMVKCKVDYPRMRLTSEAIVEPEYDEEEKAWGKKKKAPEGEKPGWDEPAPQ